MRYLLLSNFYPPNGRGGYEQLCHEVAHALCARGHKIAVLTTRGGIDLPDDPVRVYRELKLEVNGGLLPTALRLAFDREKIARQNVAALDCIVADFEPDAALVWGMWNVSRNVPERSEKLLPTAYYLCDYWPTLPNAYIQRLREPARHAAASLPKKLLTRWFLPRLMAEPAPKLAFRNAACVSFATRDRLSQAGIIAEQTPVIYNGIDTTEFADVVSPAVEENSPIRLIYAGRLVPEKGVHTILEALVLVRECLSSPFELMIIGAGSADYEHQLRTFAATKSLPVTFAGFVPRPVLPEFLGRGHILVFPSQWEEPLSRAVFEGMAAGLAVVGTTTGGTGEVLVDGETGLTFDSGDAAGLAEQLVRLIVDESLRSKLAARGREIIFERFDIVRTVDGLESLLMTMTRSR